MRAAADNSFARELNPHGGSHMQLMRTNKMWKTEKKSIGNKQKQNSCFRRLDVMKKRTLPPNIQTEPTMIRPNQGHYFDASVNNRVVFNHLLTNFCLKIEPVYFSLYKTSGTNGNRMNQGRGDRNYSNLAPSPTPWCSSYRKGSLRVTVDYGRQLYFYLYRSTCR